MGVGSQCGGEINGRGVPVSVHVKSAGYEQPTLDCGSENSCKHVLCLDTGRHGVI